MSKAMIVKYFNVSRRADSKHNSSSHKYKQSMYTGTAADTVGAVSMLRISLTTSRNLKINLNSTDTKLAP